jgi:hypothetical protein
LVLDYHYGGYSSGGKCDTDDWLGMVISSSDGGVTWGSAAEPYGRQLPTGFLGGIK